MNYYALREEFISPREETQPNLPKDFSFNSYLCYCLGHALGDLVEISPLTWVCLEIFFTGVYIVSWFPFSFNIFMYFLWGWILLGWMAFIAVTGNQIKLSLVPRYNSRKGPLSLNEGSALLGEQFSPPKFLRLKLKRRTKLGKFLFGAPANKHQMLFVANRKGPEFMLFNIRLIVLLSSIEIAGLAFVCYSAPEWWYFTFYVPLALLPIICLAFYTPRVLRLWVLTTSVEMLKHHDIINRIIRDQRTEKKSQNIKSHSSNEVQNSKHLQP